MTDNEESLTCGCCGRGFYGVYDGNHDKGYGTCPDCMREQVDNFCKPGIELLLKTLKPENAEKFQSLDKDRQQEIVLKAWEDGVIVWGDIKRPGH